MPTFKGHRHSLQCLVPPYMLRNIVEKGTPQERTLALETMSVDSTVRSMRAISAEMQAGGRSTSMVAASNGNQRAIFDVKNKFDLPGTVVRSEGDPPTGDPAVDQAFEALGLIYEFYNEVYRRESLDDDGLPLRAVVHFGERHKNAYWNGEFMLFGDGDGRIFVNYTAAVDVIGHELTHGVIADEARLVYLYQAGALNESIADVFGILVKQYKLKQTADKSDWMIGEGVLGPTVKGTALRSLKEPGTAFDDPLLGKDPQPGHMKDFVQTAQDNGGVHTNSGIPNHAFYLLATKLGGFAWEKAGRIWYETLRDQRIRSTTGFRAWAGRTVVNAGNLYGVHSAEKQAVVEAWNEVGIKVSGS